MICRDCQQEFETYHGKPGFINQCPKCATDIPRVGGNMIWEHKTAPSIEIKSLSEAKNFAKKTKRFGAGVTCSLVQSKLTPNTHESNKSKSGAEIGAQYYSKLGEKRQVK